MLIPFVQGSACVYSRKVEYLYTLIYQALELLSAQTKKKKVSKAAAPCRVRQLYSLVADR